MRGKRPRGQNTLGAKDPSQQLQMDATFQSYNIRGKLVYAIRLSEMLNMYL